MPEEQKVIHAVEVTDDQVHIIHLSGVVDASTIDEFENVLEFLISQSYFKFIVDLSQVDFISSAGWGIFVSELKRLRENGGDLVLVGMEPDITDVFLLLELDTILESYPKIDDGLRRFGSLAARPSEGASKAGSQKAPGKEFPVEVKAYKRREGSGSRSGEAARGKPEKKPAKAAIALPAPGAADAGEPASRPGAAGEDSLRKEEAAPEKTTPQDEETLELEAVEIRAEPPDPWLGDEPEEGRRDTTPAGKGTASAGTQQPAAASPSEAAAQEAKTREAVEPPVEEFKLSWNYDPTEDADVLREFKIHGAELGLLPMLPAPPVDSNGGDAAPGFFDDNFGLPGAFPDLSDDPILEKIISVVIANPSYGPSAIRNMLIEMDLADESLTRSIVYRKLSTVNLTTREKRRAFARANSL